MKHRIAVPEPTAARLLVANQRACCICHQRKHLQIHHIDGDTSNNADGNLAPLCLDCHSHVTGDEGLGRRYTKAEVSAHKRAWEQTCADNPVEDRDDDQSDEPVPVLYETVLLRREEEIPYDFELDEGDELNTSVSATGYVDIMVCGPEDYERWCKGKDIDVYMDADEVMEKIFTFQAPESGTYLLVVTNTTDEDVDVTVDVDVLSVDDAD
jgi:hypothetical protein